MVRILIVDDRPDDRELLGNAVRSHGHEVVEATDGHDALRQVAANRPDLVISSVLMPTLDGHELDGLQFVHLVRRATQPAAPPIIFSTPAYHEREARALAHQCGAADILIKPSPSQAIVTTVNAALDSTAQPDATSEDRARFDRDHLRLVNSRLAARADRVEASQLHMVSIMEAAQQIAAEREPIALIEKLCTEARRITLARQAILALFPDDGSVPQAIFTSGFDEETAAAIKPPCITPDVFAAVAGERRPVRTSNPSSRPEAIGLPAEHPPVSSYLYVPIASPSRVYGWLSLRNKLGTDEFTDADERGAVALGTHAGIAYETTRLSDVLNHRIAVLEEKLRRRSDRAANGLRPKTLDTRGFLAVLEWQAHEFERRSGIRCRFDPRIEDASVDEKRSSALFRIVEQALTNIIEHARATRVTVSVRGSAQWMTIAVADNGRGISRAEIASAKSLGLIEMREEAAELGASLEVRKRRPSGTLVTVTVPLTDRLFKPRM